MKSIGKAAMDAANVNTYFHDIKLFTEGAEFTQRFIPIEEELPPMKQQLIVKHKNEQTGHIEFGIMSFIDSEITIKELCDYLKIEAWRPIFFQ